jgi:hypothetical protein
MVRYVFREGSHLIRLIFFRKSRSETFFLSQAVPRYPRGFLRVSNGYQKLRAT